MAKTTKVNKSPLSMREGKVYLDGVEVADSCKCQIVFTPKVWEGQALGDPGTNRRWIGYDITVTIESWKTNNRWASMVQRYIKNGATPEFKIQGVQADRNSDYYAKNKTNKITAVGCVPTGDINLLDMDTDGEVVKESIKFGAKKIA